MAAIPALLLQDDLGPAVGGGLLALGGTFMLVMLVVAVIVIVGFWKVFTKAGQPGWAILIPIYNAIVMLKIAGKPAWWVLLFLIPLVNIVVSLLVAIEIAKAFGQSAAFGVILCFLLGGIGYVILGFGNYRYLGAQAAAA
jgi:hypothetical protein